MERQTQIAKPEAGREKANSGVRKRKSSLFREENGTRKIVEGEAVGCVFDPLPQPKIFSEINVK